MYSNSEIGASLDWTAGCTRPAHRRRRRRPVRTACPQAGAIPKPVRRRDYADPHLRIGHRRILPRVPRGHHSQRAHRASQGSAATYRTACGGWRTDPALAQGDLLDARTKTIDSTAVALGGRSCTLFRRTTKSPSERETEGPDAGEGVSAGLSFTHCTRPRLPDIRQSTVPMTVSGY